MQNETKWYAATPTGREALRAKSDEEALAEVKSAKGWVRDNTYAILRIDMTVVKEFPAKSPIGRTLNGDIRR